MMYGGIYLGGSDRSYDVGGGIVMRWGEEDVIE